MRRAIVFVLLATGCENLGELKESFCKTAHAKNDAGSHAVSLCDDFEESQIDSTLWQTTFTTDSTLEIVRLGSGKSGTTTSKPSYAYRGRGVLHAKAPANGAALLIESTKTPEQKTGDAQTPAFRAFLWPDDTLLDTTTVLFSLVDANGAALRELSLVNGVPMLIDVASGRTALGAGTLTNRAWNCVDFTSDPASMTVVFDNGSGAALSGLPAPAAISASHIGASNDASAAAAELWLDEVIIDSTDIGCDP